MNGFQNFVNSQPAPAQAGDIASVNPCMSMSAPPGGYLSPGADLCIVGRFGWGNPATGILANYYQAASLLGFIHRENQAIIVPFLAFEELGVEKGLICSAQSRGDFWAKFLAGAAIGNKVYADALTGQASAAAAGSGTQSLAFTATLGLDAVLHVSAVVTATLAVGMVVTGAGVPAGTFIVSQLTGGAGGVGTYQLNQPPAIAIGVGEAMDARGLIETPWFVATTVPVDAVFTGGIAATGILTVSAVGSGAVAVGQFISGIGVPPYTYVVSKIDATHFQLNNYVLVAPGTALTGTQGQLGKISTWQN